MRKDKQLDRVISQFRRINALEQGSGTDLLRQRTENITLIECLS